MIAFCLDCNKEILITRNKKYCDDCKHKRQLAQHRKNYQDHRDERLIYQENYAEAHGIAGCIDRGREVGYRFIKRELRRILYTEEFYEGQSMDMGSDDEPYVSTYLGSALSLDPCGKYHHFLSPNGVTKTCIKFWENLNKAAEDLGGWIESGDGNGLDTFLCFMKSTYDKKVKNHNRYTNKRSK